MSETLGFDELAAVNRGRCESPVGFRHPLGGWSLSDWMLAATGEFGEAANKAKKLNRYRDGIPGNAETEDELRAGFADEIADAVIYLDLTAQAAGFTLADAVISKFNRTSEKIGAPHRLPSSARPEGLDEAQAALPEGWHLMVGYAIECSYCWGWWATASKRLEEPPHYPQIITSESGRPRGEHHDATAGDAIRALLRRLPATPDGAS